MIFLGDVVVFDAIPLFLSTFLLFFPASEKGTAGSPGFDAGGQESTFLSINARRPERVPRRRHRADAGKRGDMSPAKIDKNVEVCLSTFTASSDTVIL